MNMKSLMLLSSLVLALTVNVKAQLPNASIVIRINTPVKFVFEHNGDNGLGGQSSYRLWCNKAIVKNYTPTEALAGKSTTPNATGEFTYTLSYLGFATAGTKECHVTAYNESIESESDPSNLASLGIVNRLTSPVNLKFVFEVKIGG